MWLSAIFLILNIQLSRIFASPPSPLPLSSQAERRLIGYECGNDFFPIYEVKVALSIALNSMDQGHRYPEKYQGKLYNELEYFLYPIRNGPQLVPQIKQINTLYFVVFTKDGKEEIDVVSKITTGDFTKCVRRYRTATGLSYMVPENANGYLCGHDFFTDDIINQCLIYAHSSTDRNTDYPSPYIGGLYPEDGGYLMWPIMRRNALYVSGTAKIGPFFLILNNQRQLVDVVVRGYARNFLRCLRSRKPPTAPESDQFSKLFVPAPKPGYICGKIIFLDKDLQENAEIIKDKVGKAIQSNLPEEYNGPPFNDRCLMWPLLQDGRLFKVGRRGPFRLILTPEYKVKSVAMLVGGKLKVCERDTIVAKKNHDKSHYLCFKQYFSNQQLVAAAEEACVKMNTARNNIYPARCERAGFKLDGPYFTYPAFPDVTDGKFKQYSGSFRVMINANCEVVGALMVSPSNNEVFTNRIRKTLLKCHRVDDGLVPPDFFGANAEIFYEYSYKVKQLKPL